MVIAENIYELRNADLELHSIAAILHDMGWDERDTLVSNDKCFVVDRANAAREFVEKQGNKETGVRIGSNFYGMLLRCTTIVWWL